MLIDMHIHTHFSSCSVIKIPQLLQMARKAGIDGICITDHNTTASKSAFEKIADNSDLCILVGIEYTTSQGDFLIFGSVDQIPAKMDANDLLKWVRKKGSVAIAAHPFRKDRPFDTDLLHSLKIIEGLNGRNKPNENELCKDWLQKHGKGMKEIGGSDAHTLEEVGQVVTVFRKNIYSMDDLVEELLYGNYTPTPLKRHS